MKIIDLQTPCLVLDKAGLIANLDRMQAAVDRQGVALRPHLKTAKSATVAELAAARGARGITVSTLAEAEYFADHGATDITYAVGITPDKLFRAKALMDRGVNLKIMTDNRTVACAISDFSKAHDCTLQVLIEIDCGDHRAGLQADGPDLLAVAGAIEAPAKLLGLLTHAGHSYGVDTAGQVAEIAEQERAAAVLAASRLREAGHDISVVSVGSTPTALFASDLTGVTEVRAGVYVFFDVDQMSRGVCTADEIALTVLASVIGHNRAANKILLDAGGLALSKDRSADHFAPRAHYGLLCDAETGTLLPELSVTSVSQEHGHVVVEDDRAYDLLPIGAKVRILPIHACMTAAAYDRYNVVDGSAEVTDTWDRCNGW